MLAIVQLLFVMFALAAAISRAGEPQGITALTLKRGAHYFEVDGCQSFLLGRNPTGWKVEQYEPLFAWARESGEKMARLHVTIGMLPKGSAGKIDEAWATRWEEVFRLAASNGVHVLPVLDVWGRWNDGSTGDAPPAWLQWHSNPHNRALGGPACQPGELLKDSECRKLWLAWAAQLVQRWQSFPNICAWEVFSELDLVTGANEDGALEFVSKAAGVIRSSDPRRRPVTASLSGVLEWPKLFASEALDIVQVHPYASDARFKGQLDEMILGCVRERLRTYGKPVLIGESGLDATLNVPRVLAGETGIRHGIWAAVISGAMTGRMLWWEDGYDQFSKVDLRTPYCHAAAPAAKFVAGVNFTGFQPVATTMSGGLFGGAIGNEKMVLGWFRDSRCQAPSWPKRVMAAEVVQLKLTGAAPEWRAEFYDAKDGKLVGTRIVRRTTDLTVVPLPSFEGSIAFGLISL